MYPQIGGSQNNQDQARNGYPSVTGPYGGPPPSSSPYGAAPSNGQPFIPFASAPSSNNYGMPYNPPQPPVLPSVFGSELPSNPPPSQGSAMMGTPYGAPPPALGVPSNGPYGAPPSAYGVPAVPYGAPGPSPYGPPPQGGRKRAVVIGCNYAGTSAQLNGCINDARCLEYMLKTKFGFAQGNILLLTDDQRDPNLVPTRANMIRAMQWLVQGAGPGDSLFFSYSGHGGQERARGGDEADGMNETFCPCDFRRAGEISDDEVNAIMVRPLGPGVRLHAITDCCHSGSSFDLPFAARVRRGRAMWVSRERMIKGTSGGLCVQFSACQDSEVAADTSAMARGVHTGAATYTFIDAVEKLGPNASYAAILAHMDRVIDAKVNGGGHGMMGGGGGAMNGIAGAGLGALVGGLLLGETGMLLGAMAGGASGVAGGGFAGQTPLLSANEQFDLNRPLCIL